MSTLFEEAADLHCSQYTTPIILYLYCIPLTMGWPVWEATFSNNIGRIKQNYENSELGFR